LAQPQVTPLEQEQRQRPLWRQAARLGQRQQLQQVRQQPQGALQALPPDSGQRHLEDGERDSKGKT
jgi:hypothetical protein